MSRSILPSHVLKLKWLFGVREAFKEMNEYERELLSPLHKHKATHWSTIVMLDLIYTRVRLVTRRKRK